MMSLIVKARSTVKSELNCHDQSNRMWFISKRRQDNDMIDHIIVIFVEYDAELSRLIRQWVVYDEDEKGHNVIDRTGQLNTKNEIKLSCMIRHDTGL